MKKITLLLTILAFVLAFGSAYGMEMTDGRTNGVTVFSPGNYANVPSSTVERKFYAEESAAGGVTEAESNLERGNGVTIFAAGPVYFDSGATWGTAAELSEGSAAGGSSREDLAMDPKNGITIFEIGPIVFDAD